jgi:hypothetical protein
MERHHYRRPLQRHLAGDAKLARERGCGPILLCMGLFS